MEVIDNEEAQRLAFSDYDPNVGDVTVAVAAIKSALGSLVTHLASLDEAVERSVRATASQAQTAEDQLEHRLLAAAAMGRANIEVIGPYKRESGRNSSEPSMLSEERWTFGNRGPAVARDVSLEIPPSTGDREGQELPPLRQRPELRLLDQKVGSLVQGLGDLQVGKEKTVRVSEAGSEAYPVRFVLRRTDDHGPHEEQRSVPYTQLPWS